MACGRGGHAELQPVPPCRPAREEAGLVDERVVDPSGLQDPKAVPLDPPVGQYVYLVAGKVAGEVGVWAVGPWLGGARIMAVDGPARRLSDWGSAITDRSAPGQQRAELAARREVAAVRACVTSEAP